MYADWAYLAKRLFVLLLVANQRKADHQIGKRRMERERKRPKNETTPTYANSLLSINKIVVASVRHVEACMYCTTVFYIYLIADRFASSCYFFFLLISYLLLSFPFSFCRRCLHLIADAPLAFLVISALHSLHQLP